MYISSVYCICEGGSLSSEVSYMKEAHYPVRCPRDIGLSHSAGHATFNHRVAFQPRLVGCVLLSLVPHSLWLIACHLESCLSENGPCKTTH